MPIYEYQCLKCQHQFELMQSITAEARGICPECHSAKVRRLISLTSFQLKGTGWYVTDYKHRASTNGQGKLDAKTDGHASATETAKDSTKDSAKDSTTTEKPAKDSAKDSTTTGKPAKDSKSGPASS